ncbi:unnamed protein product [Phytomonas sp. EM1]|nr:unnamed protein product [Phytomonas sp. EM1]|eukprot:CCW59932.1 unnamed protein product [Phytomonas sp. isolate EM1]
MSSSSNLRADSTGPIFNMSGGANLNTFTADDRMLLWTLYHQQQIIQFQLNLLMPSIQEMKKTLDEMGNHLRSHRSRDLRDIKEEKRSEPLSSAPSPAPAPVRTESTTAPIPVEAASTEADRTHAKVGSARLATATVEESRSCTPPVEVSGHPSTMNRSTNVNNSVDSVAAPWDPSTGAPNCRASSLSSTVVSQLNRSHNPLLSSRHSRTAPMAHGAASGSRPPSRIHSLHSTHLEAGGGGGRGATGNNPDRPSTSTSATGYVAPTIAPPRVSSMPTLLDREIPPYRNITSAGCVNQIDLEGTSGLLKRGYPTVTKVSAEVTQTKEPATRGTTSASFQPVSKTLERFPDEPSSLSAVRSSESKGNRAFSGRKKDPHPDLNSKDDSFSEGYGSYESQEYLRGIGLLQRYDPH